MQMTIICQVCNLEKRRQITLGSERQRVSHTRKSVQREIDLQLKVCSDCLQFWKYKSLVNRKPVSEMREGRNLTGKFAEIEAARHLRKRGYDIATTNSTGPDIILNHGGHHYRVEIKSASLYNGRYTVAAVYPNRLNDHIIGYRFNRKDFVWSTMAEHLKYCDPRGCRDVTHLNNKASAMHRTFERALEMVGAPTMRPKHSEVVHG